MTSPRRSGRPATRRRFGSCTPRGKSGQVLLDAAPPELKTDLQTTATLRKRIYELQVQAGFDPSKLDTAALAEAAKDPKVAESTRRVLGYMTTTCGISVGN